MAELRFMRSLMRTETVKVIEIVEATVMVLVSEEWLFEVVRRSGSLQQMT